MLPSASYHNYTTSKSMSFSVHSVNSTITFPKSYVMNVLAPRSILKDRIAFYHEAFDFVLFLRCALPTTN